MQQGFEAARIGLKREPVFSKGIGRASCKAEHVPQHLPRRQLNLSLAELILTVRYRSEQSNRSIGLAFREQRPGLCFRPL